MSDEHITYRGRRAIVTASIVGTLAFVGGIGKMCYDIIIPMPNRTVANQIRQVNILSSNISYLKTQMLISALQSPAIMILLIQGFHIILYLHRTA